MRVWLVRLPLKKLALLVVQAVGFDMDYTLSQYKPETFEKLAHDLTVEKLVGVFGYPEASLPASSTMFRTLRNKSCCTQKAFFGTALFAACLLGLWSVPDIMIELSQDFCTSSGVFLAAGIKVMLYASMT